MELKKIFLVLTLIFILTLSFVAKNLEPQKITISNITPSLLDQQIKVQTKIISLRTFQNQSFQILKLQDSTGKIDATANSKTPLQINYTREYQIIGKVSEYNKTLQISVDKISIIQK